MKMLDYLTHENERLLQKVDYLESENKRLKQIIEVLQYWEDYVHDLYEMADVEVTEYPTANELFKIIRSN